MSRRLWALVEPVHDVTYFSPQARAAFEAAGLRGFWRGYFGGRAAPLGPVGAAPVIAIFYVFAPQMVNRALPDVWTRAEPSAALDARLAGAVEALSATAAALGVADETIAEAADLVATAAGGVRTVGRPLSAANAALPVPDGDLARLWHAATVLREHRGDGHWASLVAADVDGCEALVWREARNGTVGDLQATRGWTDEEWAAAKARLAGRGWLDADGAITDLGRQEHKQVEEQTDRLSAAPWERLDGRQQDRLVELLTPLSKALYDAIPNSVVGAPRPT
ncbi:SCO6745 family protein [Virgisporangium ochraceum]|uniref:SalK n=1 Tax=Virgisporangium ochraceum TaxID=65505 RepID=A0A8J3ZN70_9ACTN|nr:hypothetical protein [Virgisporangium ochraceum]GIJ65928.1 hypothetical protein Voc01_008450 [Virgisporangium ochraceum]